MLRILLDLQTLQSDSRHRGIGNYTRGLTEALLRRDEIDWHVLLSDAMPDTLLSARRWAGERLDPSRIHVLSGLRPTRGEDGSSAGRRRAAETLYTSFIDALDVDLVHVASPFDGWGDETVVAIAPGRETACSATVYDLIPFEEPEIHLPTPEVSRWFEHRLAGLTRVEAALAISDHTARVARDRLGLPEGAVVSIGADVDPIFAPRHLAPEAARALLARYRITRDFLIHVGIPEPRKNIPRLIEAFARLPEPLRARHQIVLATKVTPAQRESLNALVARLGLPPDALVLAGFVPDADLADLYSLAAVTVMPSLNEGFGLPLLEAMRCGCPVLGSNTTSIPQVIGRDDLTFDPLAVDAIAARLERVLGDADFRREAIAHGERQQARFSWAESADRACAAFAQAAGLRRAPGGAAISCPDLSGLAPGRYWLPVAPDPDLPRPAPLPLPEAPEALHAALVAAGPALVLDLAGPIPDRPEPAIAPASPPPADRAGEGAETPRRPEAPGASRSEAPLHPHLVATLGSDASAASWQLAWHSWPRTWAEAPAPESLPGPEAALARVTARHPLARAGRTLDALRAPAEAREPALTGADRDALAAALAANHAPAYPRPRLLVDVSELALRDARSGIQRVVRNILGALVTEPHGYEVVPVRREENVHRYARAFTARFLGTEPLGPDSPVDFRASDTFLGLDFDATIPAEAVARLQRQHLRGLRLVHVVYDTLPLHRPDWFGPGMHDLYRQWLHTLAELSDGIACISQAVADDLQRVMDERRVLKGREPVIGAFHLGADLDAGRPAPAVDPGLAADAPVLFEPGTPVFVTVGTLEPRKGHAQLLDAAEILWARGNPVVFAIVGKRGWLVDELIARLETHPERDRRLRWFEAVDDAVLAQVYRAGSAALLPSEGEGFGLPLVEAAHAGLPILARDLPVFREIGGDHATYFRGFDGRSLADAIEAWLAAHARGTAPSSQGIAPLTWSESARQLMRVVQRVAHRP